MAANARWRATRTGWRERVLGWLGRAQPEDLLDVDIFFDLAPVRRDLRSLQHALRLLRGTTS